MKTKDHYMAKVERFVASRHWLDWLVLLVGLAVFVTITFINAPRASIWFDEAFSAYITQFSFVDIAHYTATDVHPPVYYWLLKIWSSMFGTTELAYRSLSIVFGVATISVAFGLTRKLFGRRVAWVALPLLIVSPMLVRYSDEARMYTLAALIVMSATWMLVKATETNRLKHWVLYGVLVSLGMWTHYFTALAWLAHWVWRAVITRQESSEPGQFFSRFFSKEWLLAYGVAVALFIPWLIIMAKQLGGIQGGGFWISPVGIDTPANFLTNYFYYLEHGQVKAWAATALLIVVVSIIIYTPRTYRMLAKQEKRWFLLISSLAWVSPLLLFILSLPPLRSSFVERYLLPAYVAVSIFIAIVQVVGSRGSRMWLRVLPILLIIVMMVGGVVNVFTYGNYNKNSNTHILTRQVIDKVKQQGKPGQPIIADSPWTFYEAIAYSTPEHPVYFIDANTQYIYGSLDMLKDNDAHKIKDVDAFANEHPVIWYLGNTKDESVSPYKETWQKVRTVSVFDSLTNEVNYRATEYRINAE